MSEEQKQHKYSADSIQALEGMEHANAPIDVYWGCWC